MWLIWSKCIWMLKYHRSIFHFHNNIASKNNLSVSWQCFILRKTTTSGDSKLSKYQQAVLNNRVMHAWQLHFTFIPLYSTKQAIDLLQSLITLAIPLSLWIAVACVCTPPAALLWILAQICLCNMWYECPQTPWFYEIDLYNLPSFKNLDVIIKVRPKKFRFASLHLSVLLAKAMKLFGIRYKKIIIVAIGPKVSRCGRVHGSCTCAMWKTTAVVQIILYCMCIELVCEFKTVNPLNNGHIGSGALVLYWKVVPISEGGIKLYCN